MIILYRLDKENAIIKNPFRQLLTRRAPGNIPYIVDNLWEWVRPEHYPSRRHCICVSPKANLALRAGGAKNGSVYTVIIKQPYKLAQIEQWDAREHLDVKDLPKKVLELLGESWLNGPANLKAPISLLWTPCLIKEEVERLFENEILTGIKSEVKNSIHFWQDAKIQSIDAPWAYPEGEGFFEAEEWFLKEVVSDHQGRM